MVHIVRQLTCALERVMEAMDSCFAHAAAGTLTLTMFDLISEQFEFVSSAMVRNYGAPVSRDAPGR